MYTMIYMKDGVLVEIDAVIGAVNGSDHSGIDLICIERGTGKYLGVNVDAIYSMVTPGNLPETPVDIDSTNLGQTLTPREVREQSAPYPYV